VADDQCTGGVSATDNTACLLQEVKVGIKPR